METTDASRRPRPTGRDLVARQVTGVVLRLLDHDWHVLADVTVPARGSGPARRADFVLVGPPGVFVVACRAVDTVAGATPLEDDVTVEAPVLAEMSDALRDVLPAGQVDVVPLLSVVGPDQLAVTEVGDGVVAGTPSALVRELSSRGSVLDDAQVRATVAAVLGAGTTSPTDVADRVEQPAPTVAPPPAAVPVADGPASALTAVGPTDAGPPTTETPAAPDEPAEARPATRSRGARIAVALVVATLLVAGGTGWVVLSDVDLAGRPAAAPSSGASAEPSEAPGSSPSAAEPSASDPTASDPTASDPTASEPATPSTPAPSATPAPSSASTADFVTVRRWGRTAVVPSVDALPSVRLSMSAPRQAGDDSSDGGQTRWVTRTVVRNLGARPLPAGALQWTLRGSDETQDWSAGEAGATPSTRTRVAPGTSRVVERTWVLPAGVEPSVGSVRLGRVQVTWSD